VVASHVSGYQEMQVATKVTRRKPLFLSLYLFFSFLFLTISDLIIFRRPSICVQELNFIVLFVLSPLNFILCADYIFVEGTIVDRRMDLQLQ
jgi:hypothetical protein